MVDPLRPIDTSAPPVVFAERRHPLQPPSSDIGAAGGRPIPTNKFYTNMLLDSKTLPAWTHPYSLWLSKNDNQYGLAFSQIRAEQRVFGPEPGQNPAQYVFCPAGIQSAVFSAREFNKDNIDIKLSNMTHLSALATVSNGSASLSVPMMNGIGLVTAIYNGAATPEIQSQVGFRQIIGVSSPMQGIFKYRLLLEDNTTWIMYVSLPAGRKMQFYQYGGNKLAADAAVDGAVIQVGSCPNESDCDEVAGAYPISADLVASVNGANGRYGFKYEIAGQSRSRNILIYALPHHVAAFTADTRSRISGSRLDSTVMGQMTGVFVSSTLEMEEKLPVNIGFLPWAQFADREDAQHTGGKVSQVLPRLKQIAEHEASQDFTAQSSLDSMYFSGKGLDKFAFLLIVAKYIIKDDNLARTILEKLKSSFQIFKENKQQNPLAYDITWKGLVSTAGMCGDMNADFGNSYYNDHHFHYGYFIHAAAVIGKVDREFGGDWLARNKHFVNSLLRDYANPSVEDRYFPQFRSFDWFNGHSWAKGLFLSGDGKDEESSSEDYHSIYSMKLWGSVIGDESMVARANLMLAIEKRSMNLYMLYSDGNTIMPGQFVGNRVSGIKFENKVDHATYFGLNKEYIQGIHMIPVTPVSSFIRGPEFCKQEWRGGLDKLAPTLDSGWRGILEANKALFDPAACVKFFADPNFKPQWLDGGMSHAWSLAMAAGVQ